MLLLAFADGLCLAPAYIGFITLCFLLHSVSAGPLLETIKDIQELSIFNDLIKSNSNLTTLLTDAKDFTLLAPTNDAMARWFDRTMPSDVVELTMKYHLLKKSVTTELFSTDTLFVHTELESSRLSNVTDGQVVQMLSKGGRDIILSANHTESTIISRVR